ncbi:MAG: NAD(P)/FAD-dependent oxidoreductase [Ruminococcaceae bacterium]|nr:NAD(P)/FAD-dependent oxidoreductase [Oscillospiraceae bacterium]
MKTLYDVAVIGGGVVGGMIARTLSAYDLSLCILEKNHDVARGASAANSSIVHAGFDAKEGSMKARMNVRGSEMMEAVCRELGVKYQNNGSLVLGFDADDRTTLEELLVRGNANGVKDLRIIEQDELRALEPNIAKEATCALHAPTGGIVCPYELTLASIGNAMDNGAELFTEFEVSEIRDNGSDFTVIAKNGNEINARFVINAAGLFADAIAKMVGDDSFTIHPRRGEYLLLDRECGGLVKNTIFRTPGKMGKGLLVTPTVDGNLLVGPTSVDQEDKTDKSTTLEGLSLIRNKSAENAEGVPFGKTITSFCGLRAVGSVGDFIINMPRERFVNVAGIESPGLSSSPAIAEYVLELLKNTDLALEKKADFNPIRPATHAFREGSIEEKNEMIKKDPAYGRIICRCEGVSEGEILAAIRQNPRPRDLDGVKRRTRAQMGRCQGGFCSPYIVEMLAKEWGLPFEAITKFGGESIINFERTKEEN